MNATHMKFHRRPNLLKIYLRTLFVRHPGLAPGALLPALVSECPSVKIDPNHVRRFRELTGAVTTPVVYPQLLVFPFHMLILGHRDFPLLYVSMMQIRNHMVQHRLLQESHDLRLVCRIARQRVVRKGLEMDVHSEFGDADGPVWESLNTYYFPGRFGDPDPPSPLSEFSPLPASERAEQHFTISPRGGFRFGLLSGDYNGIHYASWYARSRGFRRCFAQSYSSLTQCLRRLPRIEPALPIRLDTAYKGPVYYDADLALRYAAAEGGYRFDLYCEGDSRPCVMARIAPVQRGSTVMDRD
jgi:hypothetical protein